MEIITLGRHRLGCGDSTKLDDVLELMGGLKANLFLIDPPYGVSYVAKNAAVNGGIVLNAIGKEIKNDTHSVDDMCPIWRAFAQNAHAVCSNEASYLWFACQGGDQMMMMMMMMMIGEAGWKIRHELIWVKSSFVFGRSDYHYKHEPILYGWKKKGKHHFYGDRKQSSVLEFKRPSRSDYHPTSKPVDLLMYLIKNHSKEGDVILDLCGGGGSTLEACERTGRTCYTMEIDPMYQKVIQERYRRIQQSLL